MTQSPLKEFKYGQKNDYVKATIWENQSQRNTTYHTVSLSRQYRDDSGWHETQTLYAHHLPLQSLASQKAFEFVHERLAELADKGSSQPEQEKKEAKAPAKKRTRGKSHAEKIEEGRATPAKGR